MSTRRSRILIVDDNADILERLSDRLQLMRFDITCAKDGQEALSIFRHEAPPPSRTHPPSRSMNVAAIPWGALLFEPVLMFLLLVGLGLSLIGIWTLWSNAYR